MYQKTKQRFTKNSRQKAKSIPPPSLSSFNDNSAISGIEVEDSLKSSFFLGVEVKIQEIFGNLKKPRNK